MDDFEIEPIKKNSYLVVSYDEALVMAGGFGPF